MRLHYLGYDLAYMYVRLMAKNIYTTQFYTKVESDSKISQKANEITLGVNQTLTNYSTTNQMNSAINLKANEITSSVSQTYSTKTELTTARTEIKQTTDGITSEVSRKVGDDEVISKINQSSETVGINANKIELSAQDVINLLAGNEINLTSKNISINSNNFSVGADGRMNCSNANISGNISASTGNIGNFKLRNGWLSAEKDGLEIQFNVNGLNWSRTLGGTMYGVGTFQVSDTSTYFNFRRADGRSSKLYIDEVIADTMHAKEYAYDSLESLKKNINKYDKSALNIINNASVYEYHYKTQNNNDKKIIGFVIGDEGNNYNTPEEVISNDRKGINSYSAIGILWKAIQEQQQQIEMLKDKINKLEKGENND